MSLRQTLLTITALAAAATLLAASPAQAKKKPDDKAKSAAAAAGGDKDKPMQEWSKITKDAERVPGFFALWKKRDNLYMEVQREQLEQPFLSIVSFARGIGSNFLLGGLPLDDRMLQFERHGDRLLLVEVNTRFLADTGTPIGAARDLSIPNSVLQSFKIESEQDSGAATLVDIGALVVSDLTDLGERMKGSLGNVSMRFDKDRSALGKFKDVSTEHRDRGAAHLLAERSAEASAS